MSSITIGLLRLTDAAPVIIAHECGFFADRGLDVRLSVEPSWANIADKLTYGRLDAAVMLPPLAFAVSLGLRGIGTPLVVPMSLSLNGNSVTVSNEIAALLRPDGSDALEIGKRLRGALADRPSRLRFAVVHVYSTHNLLLRYWLATSGIDPDRDVELTVVPPADTAEALKAGHIDGFCAGAPWGAVAARAGVGWTVVTSSEIWRNHPEKCFGVSRAWAANNPGVMSGLIEALIDAARFCDNPVNAEAVAAIVGSERYLAIAPEIIRQSLPSERPADGGGRGDVDRLVFFANTANFPWRSHADWFLGQMTRWRQLPAEIDRAEAAAIYRPDLFRAAAARAGVSVPVDDRKAEGSHSADWQAEGTLSPIAMGPDAFCDGELLNL